MNDEFNTFPVGEDDLPEVEVTPEVPDEKPKSASSRSKSSRLSSIVEQEIPSAEIWGKVLGEDHPALSSVVAATPALSLWMNALKSDGVTDDDVHYMRIARVTQKIIIETLNIALKDIDPQENQRIRQRAVPLIRNMADAIYNGFYEEN